MPEKLFARRPSRRGRLVVLFIASLLAHAGLVGVAALRPQLKSWEIPPETTEVSLEAEPVQELILPLDTPPPEETPPEPTPPPDDTPEPDTPPPSEEPDMTDIATPTPTPAEKKPRARATPPPAGAKKGPVPQPGVVGGVPSAAKTAGTPGGSTKGGGRWVTPRPPYPYQARASRVQGNGSVRVTTDGSGRVTSASIAQSVGSGILDANTTSFARSNWSGPPNSSTTVPITYRLQ